MLIQIPDVLSAGEVMAFREALERAAWADGRDTAGDQAATVKNNLQIPPDSAIARDLGEHILHALARNPTYTSAALPLRVLPPMFNRYDPGMTFGAHTDNAIRTIPGSGGMRMARQLSFSPSNKWSCPVCSGPTPAMLLIASKAAKLPTAAVSAPRTPSSAQLSQSSASNASPTKQR